MIRNLSNNEALNEEEWEACKWSPSLFSINTYKEYLEKFKSMENKEETQIEEKQKNESFK